MNAVKPFAMAIVFLSAAACSGAGSSTTPPPPPPVATLAPPAPPPPPARTEMFRLETRDATMAVHATGDGPRFTVSGATSDLTEADLRDRFPQLYEAYKTGTAGRTYLDARVDRGLRDSRDGRDGARPLDGRLDLSR